MLLDARDRAILGLLESDSRMPVSHIAKKVRLSKDGVAYRIRRMGAEGVIVGFYTVLNITKLGLLAHKVTIKLQNAEPKKEAEIIDYLKTAEIVGRLVNCDGRWDLMFITWTESTYEFDKFMTKFMDKYGSFVQEKEFNIITESHSCKRKYLVATKPEESVYSGAPSRARMDEVDLSIVKLMANDSRARLVDLAKEVGMTPEAVRQRVKNLIDKDVMQKFRPILNESALGRQFYNVMIRLHTTHGIERMFEYFKHHPSVIHYSKYNGTFDLGVDVEIEGPDKFREMTSELKTNFAKEIRNYEPLLVYKQHKITYSPFNR
ncbi:MAG: AsnC family transcriptional regulator [Candidatus Micrarchaeota archaeon]